MSNQDLPPVVGSVDTDKDFSMEFLDDSGNKRVVVVYRMVAHGRELVDMTNNERRVLAIVRYPSGNIVGPAGILHRKVDKSDRLTQLWVALIFLNIIKRKGASDYIRAYPVDPEQLKIVNISQSHTGSFSGVPVENLYECNEADHQAELNKIRKGSGSGLPDFEPGCA